MAAYCIHAYPTSTSGIQVHRRRLGAATPAMAMPSTVAARIRRSDLPDATTAAVAPLATTTANRAARTADGERAVVSICCGQGSARGPDPGIARHGGRK